MIWLHFADVHKYVQDVNGITFSGPQFSAKPQTFPPILILYTNFSIFTYKAKRFLYDNGSGRIKYKVKIDWYPIIFFLSNSNVFNVKWLKLIYTHDQPHIQKE